MTMHKTLAEFLPQWLFPAGGEPGDDLRRQADEHHELLFACYRSGQIPEADWDTMLREDPILEAYARYHGERITALCH